MSQASDALHSIVNRPRSAEEIRQEWETASAQPVVVVTNGQEIELPSSPTETPRVIGTLPAAVDD